MASTKTAASKDGSVDARTATRDLVLALADSKRLLGMRYADWLLGAPELEAGIACAGMAQDEWGHARLLYSLLRDFDEDVNALEHGREADAYHNIELLDRSPADWPALVALNAFADAALCVQLEAARQSSHAPLRQRVDKILEEEQFHGTHGVGWFRRLATAGAGSRAAAADAARGAVPVLLRWFGPDSPADRALVDAGVTDAPASELRRRFAARIAPLLEQVDAGDVASAEPDFGGYDPARRRGPGGPDAETLARVRGDRNRAFLMD